MPTKICSDCTKKLIDAHKFRKVFIASDEWLRLQTTSVKHDDETEIYWSEELVDNDDLDYLDLDLVARIENSNDVSLQMQSCESAQQIVPLKSQILTGTEAKPIIETVERSMSTATTTKKSQLVRDTCGKELPNKLSVERQQISHHMDTDDATPVILKVEVAKIAFKSQFICSTCSKELPNETSLNRHQSYHRKDKTKCPLCSKLFSHSSNLKRHILVHKTDLLTCDKCPKTFRKPANLYDHMKDHRSDSTTTTEAAHSTIKHYVMHCEMCSEETESFAMFAKHMQKEHGITDRSQIKPFKCEVCAMHFASKQGMNRHIDNIHENNRKNLRSRDKNFLCNTCGKNFYTNFHLDVHIRSHTGERPFKCQLCDKSFAQMSGLKMHTFTHTGERPFRCSKCPKTFNQYGHVREHMLTHSSDRPHVCPVCNRSFRVKGNLTAHMLIHSGKKPYKCQHCGRQFRKSTLLLRHVEKKHVVLNTSMETR